MKVLASQNQRNLAIRFVALSSLLFDDAMSEKSAAQLTSSWAEACGLIIPDVADALKAVKSCVKTLTRAPHGTTPARALAHALPPEDALLFLQQRAAMFTWQWQLLTGSPLSSLRKMRALLLAPPSTEVPRPPARNVGVLRVASLNVSALRGRENDVVDIFRRLRLDILALQEVRYPQQKRFPSMPRWLAFQHLARQSGHHGGGVALLYRRSLRLAELPLPATTPSTCERLWLALARGSADPLFVASIYQPPGVPLETSSLSLEISALKELGGVVLLGDFNAEIRPSARPSTRQRKMLGFLRLHQLRSANTTGLDTHTQGHSHSELDYVLATPQIDLLGPARVERMAWLSDHDAIYVDLAFTCPRAMLPPRFRVDRLKQAAYYARYFDMVASVCDKAAATLKTDAPQLDSLLALLHNALVGAATTALGPQKRPNPRPRWFTPELASLCGELHSASRSYGKLLQRERRQVLARALLAPARARVSALANSYTKAKIRARREHFAAFIDKLQGSEGPHQAPRLLWHLLRSLHRPRAQADPVSPAVLTRFWAKIWRPSDEAAEEAEAQLLDVEITAACSDLMRNDNSLAAPFTLEEVQRAIQRLPNGKSADYLGLCAELVKAAACDSFVCLLQYALNLLWDAESLRGTLLPSQWRTGLTHFLAKKVADPTLLHLPQNYRPITIAPITYKILEAILQVRLASWFDAHLHPMQGGFRPRRACQQQLAQIVIAKEWAESANKSLVAVGLDIAKAFDSMSHSIAVRKLLSAGLDGRVARLLLYLLRGHTNRVASDISFEIPILRGALQGSILAPFEFAFFIDELPVAVANALSSRKTCRLKYKIPVALLYADDTTLIATPGDAQTATNAALNVMASLGLSPNVAKSEMTVLGKKRTSPPTVEVAGSAIPIHSELHALGVSISNKWASYKKSTRAAAPLPSARREKIVAYTSAVASLAHTSLSKSLAMCLVRGTVLPSLLYGCEIAPPGNEHVVLLNNAIREVLGAYKRAHRVDLYRFVGLWRLPSIAMLRAISFFLKSAALPSSYPVRKALHEAKVRALPYWHWLHDAMCEHDLGDPFAKIVDVLLTATDEELQRNRVKYEVYIKDLLSDLWRALDLAEAAWCGSLELPLRPNALLDSPHANIGFLFTCDSFNPKDVVESQGEKPCRLCGALQGDTPRHLLAACLHGQVLAITNTIELGFKEHLRDLQSLDARDLFYIQRPQVATLLEKLRALYSLRKGVLL
jgi:endonuclease/exonuclease/phosphatase family metal-dependent hydrolase